MNFDLKFKTQIAQEHYILFFVKLWFCNANCKYSCTYHYGKDYVDSKASKTIIRISYQTSGCGNWLIFGKTFWICILHSKRLSQSESCFLMAKPFATSDLTSFLRILLPSSSSCPKKLVIKVFVVDKCFTYMEEIINNLKYFRTLLQTNHKRSHLSRTKENFEWPA
jgi:hypothetical protein